MNSQPNATSRRRRSARFIIASVLIAVLAAVVFVIRYRPFDQPTTTIASAVSTSRPVERDATSQQTASADNHPLDPVLKLAREALAQIRDNVDDYRGRLVKRERIGAALGNEVQMEFKIRTRREEDGNVTRPLSAYLKFLEPKSARGREVIWTEGANDNKLIGHEGGMLNLMRVQLEPTGMLAMIDNKYPITEIGLTRLVEKLIEKGERDRQVGPCEVQIIEDQRVGDRTCRLIQVTHPQPDPRFDFHIAQIFIDVERMIPLRYAAFMWPKAPGDEPPLEEEYTYLDVELNVGLTDTDFDPDNPTYKFP